MLPGAPRVPAVLLAVSAGLISCVPGSVLAPGDQAERGSGDPEPAGVQARAAWRIREEAGLPAGAHAGVRPDRLPGPLPGDLPVHSPALSIRSRTEAQALAHRGAGTAEDPWVIEELDVVPAGEAFAFLWDDPAADYHVRIENCTLRPGTEAGAYVRTATGFVLRGSEIRGRGGDGADGIRVAGGEVRIEWVRFDGLGRHGIRTVGEAPIVLHVSDCEFSDRTGPWGDGATGVQSVGTNPAQTIQVTWCDFAAASLGTGVRTWRDAAWTVESCRFRGGIGIRGGDEEVTGVRVIACVFETSGNAIRAENWTDWEVAHCDFRDNDAGHRLARFDDCVPGRAHHSRFRKTTGADAGNECLESFDSRDVVFEHNWVETASEDGFEHVRPRGSCIVRHCVGDDVAGQIVDYFGHHPENGGEIAHIYGDCADVSVLVTDCDGITIHDIHTDNRTGRWGNVVLEQRHAEPGEHPSGCEVRWPLPAPAHSADGLPFAIRGEPGPENSAVWWENGSIRRFP